MSALSDWAKALYEQLQDCPNNETGWEIIEEAGKHLKAETKIAHGGCCYAGSVRACPTHEGGSR